MYQRQKKNVRYYIIKHFVYLFIFCCIIWFLPSRPQAATNVTRKTVHRGFIYLKDQRQDQRWKLDFFQSTYSICDRKGKNTGKVQWKDNNHRTDREEKIPLCHQRSYPGTGDHSQ